MILHGIRGTHVLLVTMTWQVEFHYVVAVASQAYEFLGFLLYLSILIHALGLLHQPPSPQFKIYPP